MTCGCGPSPSRSRIASTSCLAWRRLGTVVSLTMNSLVGAKQHAVGPGKPGARHVEHDEIEMRRHEIEQPGHHIGIERAHFRGPVRRRDHGQAGRVIREHDFEQLPIEPLRARLDLAEIEARLDVEIIGAGAVLEVEIDQASRGLAARAAVEQQHRGLHRERGDAGAADRRQKGEDLRLGRLGLGRGLGDPRASADQFGRRHRLDQ